MLQRLLIQRVQHRVTGAIGSRTGALRSALAIARRHAAERTLIDLAVFGSRERQAVVLELENGARRLFAHELDRVLIAEPVRTLHGVVHVPTPIVLAHVAERRADAALRSDRMTARREHLRQTGRRKARMRQAKRCTQTCAAGADDDHVVTVIDELIRAHAPAPKAILRTAKMPSAPSATCTKLINSIVTTFAPLPVDVILDDDLHAELRVIHGRADKQDQHDRVDGLRDPDRDECIVQIAQDAASAATNHRHRHEQRDGRHALRPPMPDPSFAAPSPSTRPIGLRMLMRHLRSSAAPRPRKTR